MGDFARDDHLLDVGPLLHVLLVLNPLHHSNHQLFQVLLLLGHVLGGFHHLDSVDSDVNHIQRMVESCLSTSPVVHMSQSNSMPIVGLGDRPGSSRQSSSPLSEAILKVGNSLFVVVTLHAHLSQVMDGLTGQVHLPSLGPDHPGHLQHLPSMLQMSNVILTAIIIRTLLVITVHVTFMILGHHGVSPEVACHSLGDILLDGSLLGIGQDIGTFNLGMSRVLSIDVNAFHGMAQHLSLQPAHLKQGLAIVEVGLSTLDVSLSKLLGKDGTALGHVINSLRNIKVLLHTLQQLLGILHAAHVDYCRVQKCHQQPQEHKSSPSHSPTAPWHTPCCSC